MVLLPRLWVRSLSAGFGPLCTGEREYLVMGWLRTYLSAF